MLPSPFSLLPSACIGHETFLIVLYIVHFNAGPLIQNPLAAYVAQSSLSHLFASWAQPHIGVLQVLLVFLGPSFVTKVRHAHFIER